MATKKAAGNPLADAMADIDKMFGAGTIVKMGEDPNVEVQRISTGIWNLDVRLGGGLPLGRMIEIFGPLSSGKTTIALTTIAESQRNGYNCAFIDMEHALDPSYAAALGVDVDNLLLTQPGYAEMALEIVERLVETGEVQVVVVDSVAAMTPKVELEGDYGNANVGLAGRIMSQALRKLTDVVHRNDVCLIWINQLREAIGNPYVNEYRPGGKALPFYASICLDVRRIETLKDKDGAAVANRTRVKIIKNKVGIPHRQAEFDLEYGKGIPKEGVLLDLALETGIIKASGAWFVFPETGETLAQGRVNTKEALRDPEVHARVQEQVENALAAS